MQTRAQMMADESVERLWTPATLVTALRTVGSLVLFGLAAQQESLTLLVIGLAVYLVGDSADGFVARILDCETRIGGVLDILSDRLCAASFYIGLAHLEPDLTPAICVYLLNFMVIDCFLSLAYLAWPIRSPNYFFLVDPTIFWWNWSKPAKVVNSAIFGVLLLITGWMWVGLGLAIALTVLKLWSLVLLFRLRVPLPEGSLHRSTLPVLRGEVTAPGGTGA